MGHLMMKNSLLVLVLYALSGITAAFADDADERAAVVQMVQKFFDAMAERDAEKLRAMLTADGVLYGYRETPDGLDIIRPTHQSFVDGIGERESKPIERFWDPQVLLHDRMAVVWAPYDFYDDGEFSHCGIDNFNLLKTDRGWKITGIVFSMETDDCAASPLGPLRE